MMRRAAAWSGGGDQVCQQTSNLAESKGDESFAFGCGLSFPAVAAVTVRKACAHIAR